MEKYKLTLKRESQFLGAASVYTVVINNDITEKFTVGKCRTYELDRQLTTIRIYIKSLGITTVDKTIELDPEDYEDITLDFRMPWGNQYTVDYKFSYGRRQATTAARAETAAQPYSTARPSAATASDYTARPSAASSFADYPDEFAETSTPDAPFGASSPTPSASKPAAASAAASASAAPVRRFCTECGAPVLPTHKFCGNCGTKL